MFRLLFPAYSSCHPGQMSVSEREPGPIEVPGARPRRRSRRRKPPSYLAPPGARACHGPGSRSLNARLTGVTALKSAPEMCESRRACPRDPMPSQPAKTNGPRQSRHQVPGQATAGATAAFEATQEREAAPRRLTPPVSPVRRAWRGRRGRGRPRCPRRGGRPGCGRGAASRRRSGPG